MSAVELIVYLDTSALLPYYRDEPASSAVQAFLSELNSPVRVSSLTKVEFASALSRWVRRGELTDAQADSINGAFEEDTRDRLYCCLSLTLKHYTQAKA